MRDVEIYSLNGLASVIDYELKGNNFEEMFLEKESSSLRYGLPMLFMAVNWDNLNGKIAFLPLAAHLNITSQLIISDKKSCSKYVLIPRLNENNTVSFVKVRWDERHYWYADLNCINSKGKFFMGLDIPGKKLVLNLVIEQDVYLVFDMESFSYSKCGLPISWKIIPKRYDNKKMTIEEANFLTEKRLDLDEDEDFIIENIQTKFLEYQQTTDCDFFIRQN